MRALLNALQIAGRLGMADKIKSGGLVDLQVRRKESAMALKTAIGLFFGCFFASLGRGSGNLGIDPVPMAF